jgi:hypothetical protein
MRKILLSIALICGLSSVANEDNPQGGLALPSDIC